MRLYIFDPNLKHCGGHYLGYAMRVAQAAEELGVEPVIVANRQMEAGVTEARVLPALALDYWEEMCPAAAEDPHEHLSRSAEEFAGSLNRIQQEEQLGGADILFFPYVNLAEVMGLARWRRQAGITPRTALLFRRDLDEQGIDAAVGARAGACLLRQALADLYAGPGSGNIRLFTDSDNLTEEHGQALRRRFQTAPIPVDPALFAPARKDRSCGCATILYLGDARTEKGYLQLPAIARELQNDLAGGRVRMVLQSNFNVPGGEPGIAAARDFLKTTPNVKLLLDPLTPAQYNDTIFSADLILLPYQADRYISRTSGILAEAICAGVPAVVPQGTWLSDQVRRHGAGVTYSVFDTRGHRPRLQLGDGASGAVAAALASLETLRSRAEERRAAYAQFHNPVRLARFVCGAAAGESHRR